MLFIAARARNIEDARKCIDMGFETLEITLPCPGGDQEINAWSNLAAEHDISFLAHGPLEGDPTNLINLKNNYVPHLKRAIDDARNLNCRGLTIHFWLESRWLKKSVIEEKVKLLKIVAEYAEIEGMELYLENLSELWPDLDRALEEIPSLGLTLDVGHAQIFQPANASPEIIEHLFDKVRHLHLHDNNGGTSPKDDLHLIPGRGIVPFDRIFKLLKTRGYNRTATLELYTYEMEEARTWIESAWNNA